MNKSLLYIAAATLGLAGCGANTISSPQATDNIAKMDSFITQQGEQLLLDGQPFRFSGSNNYYMHYGDNKAITSVLDDAQAMGLNALRIWGFMDGIKHGHSIQSELGVYTSAEAKSSLERLDFTISEAQKRGIRLVIALTNNWADFGGMPQYVRWLGGEHHDDFYRMPEAREAYKAYVEYLLTHTNRYTGVAYNQDPTIMTWELANEPRAQSDKSGELLYDWAKEMSEYIRELAPNQLIALGDEGFFTRPGSDDWAYNGNEGVDWERLISLPEINYGTFHLYPEHWGRHEPLEWGNQWITEHLEAAAAANKPVVLEEYGIGAAEPFNRDLIYHKWNKVATEGGAAGTMFWILTSYDKYAADKLYPNYDGFRVLADGGRTQQVLEAHTQRLLNGAQVDDAVYFAFPIDGMTLSDPEITISSYVVNEQQQTKSVLLRTPAGNVDMLGPNADGYYQASIDSEALGFGEHTLITVATLDNGKRITDKINVTIDRPVTGYEVSHAFDFSDGTLQGWVKEGSWQAKWKANALEVSSELGSPMLKLNLEWSGKNDWEELKLRNQLLPNFKQHNRFAFDLYIPANANDQGGVRPYAALGDGWVKLDVDKYRQPVSELEKVTMNGKEYYKQSVVIELGDISSKVPDLFICVVGDMLPLDGSVYLDNIHFLSATYD
ncbi:cellulase family glycosylhydrolase [Aliagarivorans taiwanensis]|uniref:cellulase family glycosylhydrolase n=1 Tax=Aliagarivorans taiwanensis TaxID=561966 RepID=UPI000415E8CB|nr:cellulase family glycosylhydrolase [Aliagarivorans taiwanensis]